MLEIVIVDCPTETKLESVLGPLNKDDDCIILGKLAVMDWSAKDMPASVVGPMDKDDTTVADRSRIAGVDEIPKDMA